MMKFQYKDNHDLVEKLNQLMVMTCKILGYNKNFQEMHHKKIEKRDESINALTEKNKKYSQGNELLIKTLKTFENELDKLAVNNKTLHNNVLFLQDQIKDYEIREHCFKDFEAQKEAELVKVFILTKFD